MHYARIALETSRRDRISPVISTGISPGISPRISPGISPGISRGHNPLSADYKLGV